MRQIVLCLLVMAMRMQAQEGPAWIHRMVRWNDSTFVDQFEVGVADWLEFMQEGGGTTPVRTVLHSLPYAYLFASDEATDTRLLRTYGMFTRMRLPVPADSMRTKTQRKRAYSYSHYPIAGITHEQALAYCAWRTQRYAMAELEDDSLLVLVEFKLPSLHEMEMLLTVADSTNGQCPLFNYNCKPCVGQIKLSTEQAHIRPGAELTPTTGYMPDALGLYNLRGNAAEMIATRGVAKGGSFMEPAQQCARGWSQPYSKPEPWLGFRCIARIRHR